MKITSMLLKSLLKLSEDGLAEVATERSVPARTGIIIKALRTAVEMADLYLWNGTPHFFDGKIYVPVTNDEFKGVIYDLLKKAKLKPADFMLLEKIQRLTLQAVQSKPLKLRKDIIVFENCVLVLPDLTPDDEVEVERKKHPESAIQKHSPKLAQTTMCHFDYDPNATCPKWKSFLNDVLDNLQLRMVLQEYLGCIYIDRKTVKLESMLILIGNGSNGKGVISETIRNLIGKDSTTSYGLDSLLIGVESLHNIAKMNGMRVNWCTEIQSIQAGRFSDKLKTLISGEPIECRQMYGQPFTALDIPLMIANCNSLPPLQDRSYGMQRRFIIIHFDKTIPIEKQDKTLLKKLEPEYPGIFNWMLEGRQRFINHHYAFTKCAVIDDAIQNYINAANNVEEWVKMKQYKSAPSNLLEQEPLTVPATTLYDEYRRWCISENIAPFSQVKFGMFMREMGFAKRRSYKSNIYRLFGEGAMSVLAMRNARKLQQALKEGGAVVKNQILKGGIVYDVSDGGAAKQWHVSRPYITVLRNKGYLDGLFKEDTCEFEASCGRRYTMKCYIYDHIRLGKRLEAIGVYDQAVEFNKLSERRKDQIRRAREFNLEMKRLGKPFRKFEGKGGKYPLSAVFVDEDWEYTADSADLAINRKIIFDDIRRKSKEVKVGKRGDIRTAKGRKMLAETIVAKIEGDPLADEKDDELLKLNGDSPIEIDMEDDDLRITDE